MRHECNSDAHLMKLLNLNEQQIPDFVAAKKRFQAKHDSIGQQIRKVSVEIIKEVMAQTPNTAMIDELTLQFGELQKAQKGLVVVHFTELKSMLNAGQQEVLKQMMCCMEKAGTTIGHEKRGCCQYDSSSAN